MGDMTTGDAQGAAREAKRLAEQARQDLSDAGTEVEEGLGADVDAPARTTTDEERERPDGEGELGGPGAPAT